MRRVNSIQVFVLIICLGLTGVIIYLRPPAHAKQQKTSLVQALSHIEHWNNVSVLPLDPAVVAELQLDDYVFQRYSVGQEKVDLFVGYYYSSGKIGAAHDPLVCFPGQGWLVSDNRKGSLKFNVEDDFIVQFSSLLAEKNGEKELVYYWYQAGSEATAGPLSQKLMLLRSRLLQLGENNAFVRFSTTLHNESVQDGQKRITSFIKDFYPVFIRYVEGA